MTPDKKLSPPAFPVPDSGKFPYKGLTKREYYASAAMQGIMANPEYINMTLKQVSDESFNMADAMIERGQK